MKLEKSPVLIEILNSFVTDGAILGATDFKTLAGNYVFLLSSRRQ